MTDTIRKYMQQHHMTAPGDTLCVGLSGGADSVCLLLVLMELYRDTRSVRLMAVHVNHCLRGEEADADEQFVRELCGKYQIPLQVYRYPVADLAAQKGIGTEEAGRLARLEAYRDCVKNHGAGVIALAHHANDRAETFLFHAARGSSLAGLAGIRAVQPLTVSEGTDVEEKNGKDPFFRPVVIRPLLCVTREEIEAWLTERGQIWRTDATNRDQTYTRNALRHTVLPFLEEQVNAQTVRHLAEASADLAETDSFLREEAENRAGRYVLPDGQDTWISELLLREPPVLQGYILLDVLEKAGGHRKDLGRVQVRQLRELLGMQAGKQADLPYGLCAVREYEGIRLFHRQQKQEEDVPVRITGPGEYSWRKWKFRVRVMEVPKEGSAEESVFHAGNIPRKKYTKWLDCDKIYDTLCIRSRRTGDRIVVNAQGGSRKFKDYLIDEKVICSRRDGIPLLASGAQIIWAVGYRISEAAKIRETTRRILEITAEPPAEV